MKIKTITLYKEDILPEGLSSNDVKTRKYIHSITRYDEHGNVVGEEHYSPDGSLEDKVENTFDDKGNLVEYINTIQGEVAEHKTWEYENGFVSREFIHYVDETKDVVKFEYDSENRLVARKYFDDDGETEQETVFEYEGDTVKEFTRDEEGEITLEKQVVNDGDKTILSSQKDHFTGEGYTLKNEYDVNGRLIATTRYDLDDNPVEKVKREYDIKGRVVRLIEEGEDKTSEVHFEYDANGNVVKQEEKQDDGTQLSQIEREYDGNNLHKSSTVFLNGMGERMSQNYNVYHEYEFYDE